jgi:hypothetical protein
VITVFRRMICALGVSALVSVPGGLATGGTSASAQPGMTVSVGTPTLTSRVLLTVPVTVVCDALPDPNTFSDFIFVSVQQASGRDISSGSGEVSGGLGSMSGGAPFLTCDGATPNVVMVPVLPASASGPFHGGPAIFTVSASHTSGGCNPFCQITGSESAAISPTSINVKG